MVSTQKKKAQGRPSLFFAKAPGTQDTHKTLSRWSVLGAQGGGIFRPRPQHKTRTGPPEKMSQTHNLRRTLRTRRAQHPHNTAHKTFEARKHFGIRTRRAHKTERTRLRTRPSAQDNLRRQRKFFSVTHSDMVFVIPVEIWLGDLRKRKIKWILKNW